MKRLSSLLATCLLVLPVGAAVASLPHPSELLTLVYFEADADTVGATAIDTLGTFASGYDEASKRQIVVVGYGDPGEVARYGEDGDGYCIGLAQRRASNVRDVLVSRFDLPAGKIMLHAVGCSSAGTTGAENRRVEVSLGAAAGW